MKHTLLAFLTIALFVSSTVIVYAGGSINSGKPVPFIGNNIESAEFLVKRFKKDYGGDEDNWMDYAKSLAETLSQLTFAEQQVIWFGP